MFMVDALVKVLKSAMESIRRARMAKEQRNVSENLDSREKIKLFKYV